MKYVFAVLCLALLAGFSPQAKGSDAGFRPSEVVSAKVLSAESHLGQTPREFIESRLGGKIVKLEKDPTDLRRAVLLVERNGSVTQHVLEVDLNPERELQEVRVVSIEGTSSEFSPVIIMPLSVASGCWSQCKKKCGEASECRVGCLFDCIAA